MGSPSVRFFESRAMSATTASYHAYALAIECWPLSGSIQAWNLRVP